MPRRVTYVNLTEETYSRAWKTLQTFFTPEQLQDVWTLSGLVRKCVEVIAAKTVPKNELETQTILTNFAARFPCRGKGWRKTIIENAQNSMSSAAPDLFDALLPEPTPDTETIFAGLSEELQKLSQNPEEPEN